MGPFAILGLWNQVFPDNTRYMSERRFHNLNKRRGISFDWVAEPERSSRMVLRYADCKSYGVATNFVSETSLENLFRAP